MNERNKTIEYYNEHAEEFCITTQGADMSYCYEKFRQYVKPKGKILDIGCGSGRDSKQFIEDGYQVEAIDASEEICKYASKYIGQQVRHQRIEEITYENEFDGIWACASLLHVAKEEMTSVMKRLYRALKKGGALYASFKYGNEERFDKERFFNDYTEEEITEVFSEDENFEIKECFVTGDVRQERKTECWVNIIVKK